MEWNIKCKILFYPNAYTDEKLKIWECKQLIRDCTVCGQNQEEKTCFLNFQSGAFSIVLYWVWWVPPFTQLTESDGRLGRWEWVICCGSHPFPVTVTGGTESLTFVVLQVALHSINELSVNILHMPGFFVANNFTTFKFKLFRRYRIKY